MVNDAKRRASAGNSGPGSIAEAVVDTAREPMLLLGADLRVKRANAAFYRHFHLAPQEAVDRTLYALGGGCWNSPQLRELLEKVLPEKELCHDFEVQHSFGSIGKRTILFNARNFDGQKLILLAMQDVTDRAPVDDQIENPALFPEQNPFPVLRVDGNGILCYANRASSDLLAQWQCAIGDRVPDPVRSELSRTLQSGAAGELEILCNGRDLSFLLVPIIERGYVNFYGRDLTERKKTLQALVESEQRYHNIFHHNHAVMLLIDPEDGKIIDANAAACAFYGYTPDEIKSLKITEINTLSIERIQSKIQMAKSAQRLHFFFQHRLADGRLRDVEVFSGPVVIEGRELLFSIIHDVTEKIQAEMALKDSEEKLRFAAAAAEIGIWRWALLEDAFHWDDQCKMLFGLASDGPVSKEAFLGRVHVDDREWVAMAVRRSLRERTEFSVELRVVTPGGGQRWMMIKGRGFYDEQGRPAYMYGIVMDVSESKRREQEIERLNADLAERAEELEDANQELEAFNYSVAHDLRKPLTIINGYCQIILELGEGRLDEECKRYLREIYEGTLRMNQLLKSLLNFSCLSHAKLQRDTVDLSALAKIVAAELTLAEPKRRFGFQIAEGITVNGDENLLRVVLTNLLGNALKYTGLQIEASIEFGMAEVDGMQACFVRDNGCGFAMEEAEKLFIPFQRLPGAESFAGFGIGLAIVERIIRRHGGRIWAVGELGKGATFYYTLGNPELPRKKTDQSLA